MAQMADRACRPADAEVMAAQGIRWPGLVGEAGYRRRRDAGSGKRNQQMQKNLGKFEI
jgi:hypothetical protein